MGKLTVRTVLNSGGIKQSGGKMDGRMDDRSFIGSSYECAGSI